MCDKYGQAEGTLSTCSTTSYEHGLVVNEYRLLLNLQDLYARYSLPMASNPVALGFDATGRPYPVAVGQ